MQKNRTFKFRKTRVFERKYVAFTKRNRDLQLRIDQKLIFLSRNPYDHILRTHKVISKKFGEVRSSRITDDLRILWKFEKGVLTIIVLLDIGGHSGKTSVY